MSENTTPTADRTPQDFAIEFAEYMAKGAEALIAAINSDAEVRLRIAESDDVSDDDEHDAQATVSEMQRALQSDIYEFRKRRDRAASAPLPAPAVGVPLPMTGDEDESDLSDWQPGGTKPALEGTYLREFEEGSGTSEFNAGVWLRDGFFPSDIQNARWRGRAQPAASAQGAGITAVDVVNESQDDSLLLCASDLQHSAIYDNHVEMQSCIRAVADRITALAATPQPAPPADSVLEDAARYRHLRDCNSGSLAVMQITGTGEDDWYILTEDDADAAIDAARKQGGAT